MNIVLYSDDINLIIHWQKSIKEKTRVVEDIDSLKDVSSSIVIINFSSCISSCKGMIQILKANNNKVLILHRTPDLRSAKEVLKYGAMGYGNAFMRDHFIVSAIHTVKEDMVWLYPELTSQLILEIPNSSNEAEIDLSNLSEREREVAMLLKEGDTYKVIAEHLNITPRTVKAHAQNIYTKLNVKDRLGLALLLK